MFSFFDIQASKKFLCLGGILVCLWGLSSTPVSHAANGLCGILDGGNYSVGNFPPGGNSDLLCDFGNASAITQNATTWDWTCGDDNVDCSANISSDPNNGLCGDANGDFYSNGPPTTALCATPTSDPPNYQGGLPDPVTPTLSGGGYSWDCIGTNGGESTIYTDTGSCVDGGVYPNCDECERGTSYPNCRGLATSTNEFYLDTGSCVSGGAHPNCTECKEGSAYPNCRQHAECFATYSPPVCGTQNGVATYDAPEFVPSVSQTNLCNPGDHTSDGTTSTVTYNAGLDQYEWQCRGDGITDTANCSALRKYDGVCGVADGGLYGSPPPANERCDTTIGGDVGYSFDGSTYTWNCEGKNGGNNSVQCSATHVIDGQCGTNNGSDFRVIGDIFVGDNCADGTSTAISDNADDFTWTCNSNSGGADVDCSANKIKDGACGLADGGTYSASPPANDRCNVGNDINLTEVGDLYTWTCDGPFGGSDANCSADIQRNAVCGPEHGASFRNLSDIAPPDQCDVGTETAPFENIAGTQYEWGCNGINGGGPVGCAANIIKDAVCDPASQGQDLYNEPISGARCNPGTESAVTQNLDQFEWNCDGLFGGADTTCSANIRIDGNCGSSDGANFRNPPGPDGTGNTDLCTTGINPGQVEPGSGSVNPGISDDGDTFFWTCMGQHNGTSDPCSANITKDGQCGTTSGQHINGTPTTNLCQVGSASPVTYDAPTLTYSWTCGGVFGGNISTTCEAFESTAAICGTAESEIFYELDAEGAPAMESVSNGDLCAPGNPINLTADDGADLADFSDDFFSWTCDGLYSGADANCQATRKYNGACGAADRSGITYTNPPDTVDLCDIGDPSLITRNGLLYEWTCGGINGGNTSPTCDAAHDGVIGSIQSGIDRTSSYMSVNYTAPASGGAATFTCFGQNNPTFQAFFDQAPLDSINLDDTPPEVFITDCLKQVGAYEFELYIIDYAGNESPQNGFYYIDVLPGDIDPNKSLWNDCSDELNYDPTDNTNPNTFPSLVANGMDECVFNLTLRDSQENLVTTIPSDEITMVAPTTNETFLPEPVGNDSVNNPWGDANVGVGFREGLRIDNYQYYQVPPPIPLPGNTKLSLATPADTPNVVPDRDGDPSNGLDFHMSAVAPSMLKLGHHAGAAAAGTLEFEFTVPDIDDFGQIDYVAAPVSISKSTPLFFYPMIRFQPNLMTYIDHLGNEQYAVFADSPIPVDNDLSEFNNDDGGGGRLVEIEDINAWLYTTLPESDTDPTVSTIDFDGVDVNIQEVDTDTPPDGTTDATRFGIGFGPQNALLNAFEGDSGQDNNSYTSALLVEENPTSGTFENQVYTSSSGYEGQEVNLVTNVSYSLPDPAGGTASVSYPGGFIGSAESLGFDPILLPTASHVLGNETLFYFRFVGASVEGGVIGSVERLSLSGTDLQDFEETYTTLLATGLSANEAREAMRAQAFEIINGVDHLTCAVGGELDFQSLMDSNAWINADVVYVSGCDVRIAEDPRGDPTILTADEQKRYSATSGSLATLLPDGQKTLVIKDGNLFVDNDLWYNDWIKDSFGFIVFNEDLTPYPQTGNIFIRHSIKRMVGTYYVEGGLFGNQGIAIDYSVFDPQEPDEESDLGSTDDVPDVIANTGEGNNVASAAPGTEIENFLQAQVQEYNRNQLILHGTLLSYNTLGGYHIWHSKIPIDGAPTNYFTAWNVMDDINPDVENEAVAIQYDLHYLRRFNVHDWGTGNVCDDVVPHLGVCLSDLNAPDGSGPDGITDYVQDLEDLDDPADGIPDGDGYADYTKGGFDSARCTPDLYDILTDSVPVRCDQNPNAFVIRNDQKVSKYPPPGFGIIGTMDLTQE